MPQGKELVLSLCKRVNLWPLPTRNYLKEIWENPSMKRKCWLFYMPWICDILIYWGNGSKLRQTIKASSIFWNNAFPPQNKKNGLLNSLDMIMRSFIIKEKTMWLRMHFPEKYEDEGSLFSLSFIIPDWLQSVRREWLQDPKSL
jgi:hypothetical protein